MQVPDEFVHQVRNALDAFVSTGGRIAQSYIAGTTPNSRQTCAAQCAARVADCRYRCPATCAGSAAGQPGIARANKSLQLRYVQQMEQEQVAYQLGVGVRHLRREQHAAIEMLAAALLPLAQPAASVQREPSAQPKPGSAAQSWEAELSCLKTEGVEVSASLSEVLQTVIKLVMLLAEKRGVWLTWQSIGNLEPVAIQEAALRQCLISLTTFAIGAAGGAIRFVLQPEQTAVQLAMTVEQPLESAGASVVGGRQLGAACPLLGDLGCTGAGPGCRDADRVSAPAAVGFAQYLDD